MKVARHAVPGTGNEKVSVPEGQDDLIPARVPVVVGDALKPYPTGRVRWVSVPGTSYLATFIRFLRDTVSMRIEGPKIECTISKRFLNCFLSGRRMFRRGRNFCGP